MLIATFFSTFPKMFGIKESFVDHSTDQSYPPAKRGSAFHGTQLPRSPDFSTSPSTHLELIEHFNDRPNADRQGLSHNVCHQGTSGNISCHYTEQAFNSSGGHKPAYNFPHIPNLPLLS